MIVRIQEPLQEILPDGVDEFLWELCHNELWFEIIVVDF